MGGITNDRLRGEETGQTEFLVLGFGGLLSGSLAISLVEFQRRKGGNELQNVHDYMLGVAFFFMAVGTLYGSRWMIGILAEQGVDWLIPANSTDPTITDWNPSANAIYTNGSHCFSCAWTNILPHSSKGELQHLDGLLPHLHH